MTIATKNDLGSTIAARHSVGSKPTTGLNAVLDTCSDIADYERVAGRLAEPLEAAQLMCTPDQHGAMSRLDETNGRCYELSGMAAVSGDDPDITLVHGTIYHPAHEVYPHAWTVSGDGTVHDHVLGTTYPSRSAHEEACDAKYLTTYTPAEAGSNMGVYNHWGPWDAATPPRVAKMTKCSECGEDDLIMEGSDLCGWCEEEAAEAAVINDECDECWNYGPVVNGVCAGGCEVAS